MTSSQHGPYARATHVLQWQDKAKRSREVKPNAKTWSQFGIVVCNSTMKLESLVIADQQAAVNTFRALYTPPVKPRKLYKPEAGGLTVGQLAKACAMIGVKS